MSKTGLTYHGLVTGHADGGAPRIQAVTPAGMLREIPLTRRDLVKLIQRAGAALELLDRREGR